MLRPVVWQFPRLARRDLAQQRAQIAVIGGRRRWGVALGGAMLPDVATGPALADTEAVAKHRDRPAPALRAHQFPRETSLSASMFSA